MAKLIVYFVHPGQRFSRANTVMAQYAKRVEGITFVDLYAEYPRHDIDISIEQQRLIDHDVILFQFPLYWYSTPSLLKEWQDLVLQHGFAYGHDGTQLAGKTLMLAITAGGPEEAYTKNGYQCYSLRTFLTPLEQTTRLCQMRYATPYVLYGALEANPEKEVQEHAAGYSALLTSIRDDTYDFDTADQHDVVDFSMLPLQAKG